MNTEVVCFWCMCEEELNGAPPGSIRGKYVLDCPRHRGSTQAKAEAVLGPAELPVEREEAA